MKAARVRDVVAGSDVAAKDVNFETSSRQTGLQQQAQDQDQGQARTGQDRTHQPGARPNCYCPLSCWLRLFSRCGGGTESTRALEQSQPQPSLVNLPPPNCRQVLHAALQSSSSSSSSPSAASAMKFKFCACALDALCRSSSSSSDSRSTPSGGNFPLEEKNCSTLPGVAVVVDVDVDVDVDVVESAMRGAWGALPLRRGPLGKSTTVWKPVKLSRVELCLVLPGSINSWKSRCCCCCFWCFWRLIRPLPGHAFCHFLVLRTQQRQTEAPRRGSRQWVARRR